MVSQYMGGGNWATVLISLAYAIVAAADLHVGLQPILADIGFGVYPLGN